MARLAAAVEIAPERQEREKERGHAETDHAGLGRDLGHQFVEIGHERQRAVAHQEHKNTMRLEVEDLVLEIALEIEGLVRRDDREA